MFFQLLNFVFLLLLIHLLCLSKNCILHNEHVSLSKCISEKTFKGFVGVVDSNESYNLWFPQYKDIKKSKAKRILAECEVTNKTEKNKNVINGQEAKIKEKKKKTKKGSNTKLQLDLKASVRNETNHNNKFSVVLSKRKDKNTKSEIEEHGWLTHLIVNSTYGVVTPTSLRIFESLFRLFGVRWNNLDFMKHVKKSEIILMEQKFLYRKHISSFSSYFKTIELAMEEINNFKTDSIIKTFENANKIISPIEPQIEQAIHFIELHMHMFDALKKLLLSLSYNSFCEIEVLDDHLEKKDRLLSIIYAILHVIPASPNGDAYIYVPALEANKQKIDIELSKISLRTQRLFTIILTEFEKLKERIPWLTFDLFLFFVKSKFNFSEEITKIKDIQKMYEDFSNMHDTILKRKYECIITLLQSKTESLSAFSLIDLSYNKKSAAETLNFFKANPGYEMALMKTITDLKLETQLNSFLIELKHSLQEAINACKYAKYFPEDYKNMKMQNLYLDATDLKKKAEEYFSFISSIRKMQKAEMNMKKIMKLTAVLKNILAQIMKLTTSELKHLNVLVLLGHPEELVEKHYNTQCIYKEYVAKIEEFQRILSLLFKKN